MLRIANFLNGIVRIKISGATPEKFINLCLARGIFLWNISRQDDDLLAFIRLADFYQIRPMVKKSGVKVKVNSYRGFPFTLKRIKRRKMLLVGAAICLFLLHTLTSYIWFVDICGQQRLSVEQIRQIAGQNGLKPGVSKDSVNIRKLEDAIMLNQPEISWAGISITGTRAVIEVVEKTAPRQEDKSPADIVAAKDGIISEIIAITGQAEVKNGDTVRKGDILIKGVTVAPLPKDGKEISEFMPQPLRANGIATAHVWYEGYGETKIRDTINQRTGKNSVAVSLVFNNEEILLKPPGERFSLAETEVVHKKLPFWRNSDVVVEFKFTISHELTAITHLLSVEEAKVSATTKALQTAQRDIPENAQVLVRDIEVINPGDKDIVRAKAVVETVEDIGSTIATTH